MDLDANGKLRLKRVNGFQCIYNFFILNFIAPLNNHNNLLCATEIVHLFAQISMVFLSVKFLSNQLMDGNTIVFNRL